MKLVRCFKGAYNAQQEIPLTRALQEFLDEGLCDKVKKERWNEQQVVAWLISSDVHLIIRLFILNERFAVCEIYKLADTTTTLIQCGGTVRICSFANRKPQTVHLMNSRISKFNKNLSKDLLAGVVD
jgi:hypothetical protein